MLYSYVYVQRREEKEFRFISTSQHSTISSIYFSMKINPGLKERYSILRLASNFFFNSADFCTDSALGSSSRNSRCRPCQRWLGQRKTLRICPRLESSSWWLIPEISHGKRRDHTLWQPLLRPPLSTICRLYTITNTKNGDCFYGAA